MVKAKECCCGCTLRIGTLILLWIALICECFRILLYLSVLLYPKSIYYRETNAVVTIRCLYFLMVSLVGATISFLGLYGIQKNMPQYLTSNYWYFCYYGIYFGVVTLVLIIYPSLYYKISMFGPSYYTSSPEYILVIVVLHLFMIALAVYFAIIVKSLRDSMIKQKYSGGDTRIPADPSALGYNEA